MSADVTIERIQGSDNSTVFYTDYDDLEKIEKNPIGKMAKVEFEFLGTTCDFMDTVWRPDWSKCPCCSGPLIDGVIYHNNKIRHQN